MSNFKMINCHTHIFNLNHVPKKYLPFGLTNGLRYAPFYKTLAVILKFAELRYPDNILSRYADWLIMSLNKTQLDIFNKLQGYYPSDTQFIILSMDMSYMGAGLPKISFEKQLADLIDIQNQYPDQCLPFICLDPRRETRDGEDLLEFFKKYPSMRGVKLYPSMGFLPTDSALDKIYEHCEKNNIPIMTHCTRGGIKSKDLPYNIATEYADPDHWIPILRKYPNLTVCLAHFGGYTDWEKYFTQPESRMLTELDAPLIERQHINWLSKILQMMDSKEFPNLYTDVSYTIFKTNTLLPVLKVLLTNKNILDKTLFGSDFYMAAPEVFDERYLSMKLRADLGEDVFRQISYQNTKKYLGE